MNHDSNEHKRDGLTQSCGYKDRSEEDESQGPGNSCNSKDIHESDTQKQSS
jgi:hypothetical protein